MIRSIVGLFLFLTLFFVVGCGGVAGSNGKVLPDSSSFIMQSNFPLVLLDSNGDQVVISAPPKRIVAIDSAAVEILFLLEAGYRIIGTHDFVIYPEETNRIPKLGSSFALDFEQIAELNPDLVVIFFDRFLQDLSDLEIPVLYLTSPNSVEGVAERMRLWGQIIGDPIGGETLASEFESSISRVQNRLSSIETGPSVYHDAAPGWWTAGKGTLASSIYALLKARNVFLDVRGFQQVSVEALVARDPQVIISVHSAGEELLKSETALKNTSAVLNGRLGTIDGALMEVAGPRLLHAMEQIVHILYPDLSP